MKLALSCLALPLLTATLASAQEPFATLAVCTAIVNNSCEGAATKFQSNVGKLYGFSQVAYTPRIVHVWYYKTKELGKSEMGPGPGPIWRCWSFVTVSKDMTGPWRLEARTPDGKVLATYEFEVQ